MSETARCSGCGKELPTSQMIRGKIFFRDRRWNYRRSKFEQFVNERHSWYCSEHCHVRDQMAHEG